MPVILSQRIDIQTDYDDVPFRSYHFPSRYKRQLCPGDQFVYYQGNRHKREQRYYFGYGVIGGITERDGGASYIAEVIDSRRFPQPVPIYNPSGGFMESLGYAEVRKSETPPWQNSIRPLSFEAMTAILGAAGIEGNNFVSASEIEKESDHLRVLEALNERYSGFAPDARNRRIAAHLDRGVAVTNALKNLLGSNCQICGWHGFSKPDEDDYIEAHHLTQIAARVSDSLCTENVILVCPNCHRELHYGQTVSVIESDGWISIRLSACENRIQPNSMANLRNFSSRQSHSCTTVVEDAETKD